MIRYLAHLLPPLLPSIGCLSVSVFLCVACLACWREMVGGAGQGIKSYDRENAWPSINNSILSTGTSLFYLLYEVDRPSINHLILSTGTCLFYLPYEVDWPSIDHSHSILSSYMPLLPFLWGWLALNKSFNPLYVHASSTFFMLLTGPL